MKKTKKVIGWKNRNSFLKLIDFAFDFLLKAKADFL